MKKKEISAANKFGHGVAFFFIAILLLAALGFLRAHPLASALSLLVFSLFYFLVVYISGQGCFVYPAVFLFTLGYYLLFFRFGITGESYPLLSLPIVIGLFLFEWDLRKRGEDLACSVEKNLGLVVLFFTIFLLVKIPSYMKTNPVGAIVPLLIFSLVYLFHYLGTRKLFSQVSSLILFSIAYLLSLYAIKPIPPAYYGPFLVLLCMGMMGLGNYYHGRVGFKGVRPLYVVGQILSLVAFLYAATDRTALLISLLLFSTNYFGISRSVSLKSTAWRYPELIFYKSSFGLANFAAFVSILLLFLYRFAPSPGVLIATLGYAGLYGWIAYHRERTVFRTRSQYVYLAYLFLTAFYLVLLQGLNPLGGLEKNMLLTVPFLAVILYHGYSMERRGKKTVFAVSLYETAIVATGVFLFLPFLAGESSAFPGLILAISFLLCFFVFWWLSRNRSLLYSFALIFSYLYYQMLKMTSISKELMGLYFIPVGLAVLLVAIFMQRKNSPFAEVFYLTWIILVGVSLLVSGPGRLVWLASFWAACFLIVSQLGQEKAVATGHKHI